MNEENTVEEQVVESDEAPTGEFIDPDDMAKIAAAKNNVTLAVAEYEKYGSKAKIADLEYRGLVQHIFIKYGMSINDRIEDSTGQITRVAVDGNDE